MVDICKELREQLNKLDILRESCVSVLVREGAESETTKKTIREFDTLAEELHDVVVLYRQPFDERLDDIERKMEDKKNLTKWEYWVLYGIDQHLKGNNEEERKRRKDMVEKWRSDEEKKRDLAFVLGTTLDRISLTKKEAFSGDIRYHYGNLVFHNLNFNNLTSAKRITLPENIGGGLDLRNFTSIKKELIMPEEVGDDLNLSNLAFIKKKLTMPKKVGGNLILGRLTFIKKELIMPEEVGDDLNLSNLAFIKKKLTMPKKVGGNLILGRLTSIKNKLTMPEEVGGDLNLSNLTSTQGITKWPGNIGGTVRVNFRLSDSEKAALEKRYPSQVEDAYL